jgi:hypothetical protein
MIAVRNYSRALQTETISISTWSISINGIKTTKSFRSNKSFFDCEEQRKKWIKANSKEGDTIVSDFVGSSEREAIL